MPAHIGITANGNGDVKVGFEVWNAGVYRPPSAPQALVGTSVSVVLLGR